MTTAIGNRIHETTDTVGTGPYTLRGAVTGRQSFVTGLGIVAPQETFYVCASGDEWEVGVGTVTPGATPTLSRDTVLGSSSGGGLINWAAGTRDIFCDIPAGRHVFRNADQSLGALNRRFDFLAAAGGMTLTEPGFAVLSPIVTVARMAVTAVGAKGELALPNGLKCKWGKLTVGADASAPDAFFTAFSFPFGAVLGYESAKDNTTPSGRLSYSISTTSITVHNGDSAASDVFYLALGI